MDKKRILIADDEPTIVDLIREILQEGSNKYQIESAIDGAETLHKVETFKPDLLILDIKMPKLDGFEVCRRLKGNPTTKDIPILVITGFAGKNSQEKMLELGANHCLMKPLRIDELRDWVERLIK